LGINLTAIFNTATITTAMPKSLITTSAPLLASGKGNENNCRLRQTEDCKESG
jgi:hypothetical protein